MKNSLCTTRWLSYATPLLIASSTIMARIPLLLFLAFGLSAFGQTADSISKIIFRYDRGAYSFGDPGKYSVTEIIEYSKNPHQQFIVTNFFQFNKYYDTATKSSIVDTIKKRTSLFSIDKEQINNLILELNTTRDNFSFSFLKPNLKAISKKEITSVAKKYDLHWKFEKDYSDREDKRTAFKELKAFYLLDSFLVKKKPDLQYDLVVIDVWNTLSITCVSNADTVEYRSQFFELFGQPIKNTSIGTTIM